MGQGSGGGEVRYTRSGAEFRITSVEEIMAGVDPDQWWQHCPRCSTPIQGGPAAVKEHDLRVHENELQVPRFKP